METSGRVYYGSDIKLSLEVDFGSVSGAATDFDVTFTMGNAQLTLTKEQLIQVNENTFLACIKSPKTQRGELKAFVRAHFPDDDFEDGIHTIVEPISVNVRVI